MALHQEMGIEVAFSAVLPVKRRDYENVIRQSSGCWSGENTIASLGHSHGDIP
jgi:hypothetical protein